MKSKIHHAQKQNRYVRLTARNALGFAAPHTWVASISPVLLGSLLSYSLAGEFSFLLFAVLLAAAILMQASVNTLNDYRDFVTGTDTPENSDDPSDAVLVYNRLNPAHVCLLGVGYMATAFLLGCYAVYRGGLIPLVLGAFGGLIVVAYSIGRLPISYLPLGEVVSGFVMGGLITVACYASYTRSASLEILLLSVPMIMGIGLIMMTNNTSDIERDSCTSRRTLPVLLGRERARKFYRALEVLWVAVTACLVIVYFPWGLWAMLAVLALSFRVLRQMFQLRLTPETREYSMGTILKSNIGIYGAYLLAIFVHTIRPG